MCLLIGRAENLLSRLQQSGNSARPIRFRLKERHIILIYLMFDICIWPFYQLDAGRPFFSVLLPWSFTIYTLQNQVPRGKNIKYVLVLYKQFRLIKICVGRQYLKLPLNYHGQIKAKSPGLGRWNSKIPPSPPPWVKRFTLMKKFP